MPTASGVEVVVVKVAVANFGPPVVPSIPDPRLVVPLKKFTVPVGLMVPLVVTVAVKVTAAP